MNVNDEKIKSDSDRIERCVRTKNMSEINNENKTKHNHDMLKVDLMFLILLTIK